jgi:hypothetical protein
MTLSRLALAAWLAVLPGAAAAAPQVTADQAISNYRKVIRTTEELDCPRPSAEEIVVCGSEGAAESERHRLPLPAGPEPGAPVRLVPGEAARGDAGYAGRYCFKLCGGFVGLDATSARKIVQGIGRALEGDD